MLAEDHAPANGIDCLGRCCAGLFKSAGSPADAFTDAPAEAAGDTAAYADYAAKGVSGSDAALELAERCTPGADQTCNDSLLTSSLHGHCLDDLTCVCGSGFSLNAATGKCR